MFELSGVNYEEVLEQGDSILVPVIASSSYREFELSRVRVIASSSYREFELSRVRVIGGSSYRDYTVLFKPYECINADDMFDKDKESITEVDEEEHSMLNLKNVFPRLPIIGVYYPMRLLIKYFCML